MNILVTGGAGYIGSITARLLQKKGHQVTVFDNLEKGYQEAIDCPLIVGDIRSISDLQNALVAGHFDVVLHFAAYIESGESMKDPLRFFENNTSGGINLLKAMKQTKVKNLVFSSTAGVYGNTNVLPLTEKSPVQPTSYYAWSKYFLEEIIKSCATYDVKAVILRYFNAAGAVLDGSLGEAHEPETHLIPLVIKTALGQRKKILIYGDDYKTKDGTAVRDYVHVEDLARAHILALNKFSEKKFVQETYNVGVGTGYSVREVIDMVRKVSGVNFSVELASRRAGDWAASYADSSKIQHDLGWKPKYGLKEIIESAYLWHQTHPRGYQM